MALEEILAHKRAEVAGRTSGTSLESLLSRCLPSQRQFGATLRRSRPAYVLEIKFASPALGVIRADPDLEPILTSYGRHADAVSVLTDTRFFGGSLERLLAVRERLTQPLLCKDFFLEPFQVAEARAHGADAILLILAAIDDATWKSCADLAGKLAMDVVTEVHDETELARAVDLGARIVGINNRNLSTLEIDMGTTARLGPRVPADRLVISESGYRGRAEVMLQRDHADAFLIGSALMREARLDAAVRHLVYGRTKICGLTRPEDAAGAEVAGATHGGLMFAPQSPRRLHRSEAERVRGGGSLEWVGVFADQPAETVAAQARALELSAVQLHGTEDAGMISRLRSLLPPGVEIWKAARIRDRIPSRDETGADRLLLDGWRHSALGGTGARFDWTMLANHPDRAGMVLAGGLNQGNAAEAASLDSWALDLSSGVETAPGIKDTGMLQQFFAERRRLPDRGRVSP